MLKKKIKQYILDVMKPIEIGDEIKLELYQEEKEYVEKNQLLTDDIFAHVTLVEKDASSRFTDAYIERCDKASAELIAEETRTFLSQPIVHLKKHRNEFIYLESKWFEIIGADAVSLEFDDVFERYTVMLGLKLQKKYEAIIKAYLEEQLHGDEAKFSVLFNLDDGLWDLNFALDYTDNLEEEWSFGLAYHFIYHFLFKLVERVEEES